MCLCSKITDNTLPKIAMNILRIMMQAMRKKNERVTSRPNWSVMLKLLKSIILKCVFVSEYNVPKNYENAGKHTWLGRSFTKYTNGYAKEATKLIKIMANGTILLTASWIIKI